jgi:hypothetical protein
MWLNVRNLSKRQKVFLFFLAVDLCVAAWFALNQLPKIIFADYVEVRHDDDEEVRTFSRASKVLFFNRVPKTGSEMMALLMQWLQDRNNFRLFRLGGNEKRRLDSDELVSIGNE